MFLKVSILSETLSALRAAERPFLTMNSHVIYKASIMFESVSGTESS